MNGYFMLVPIAILILGGTGIVSQAFGETTITVETDKNIYDHASVIIVTGQVEPVDLRGSDVTIMCISPIGGICGIQQLSVNSDGSFSTTINTSTALMKYDGVYEIKAQYSMLADASVSVELTEAIETYDAGEVEQEVIGKAVTAVSYTHLRAHET